MEWRIHKFIPPMIHVFSAWIILFFCFTRVIYLLPPSPFTQWRHCSCDKSRQTMVDVLWQSLLFLTALYSTPTLLDIIVVQSYSLSTATPSSSNDMTMLLRQRFTGCSKPLFFTVVYNTERVWQWHRQNIGIGRVSWSETLFVVNRT